MAAYAKLARIAEDEIAGLKTQLPSEVRAAMEDLPVHLQAVPEVEISEHFGDDLLGLFTGEVIHERGDSLDPSPPQIHLYLENIWEEADHDPANFREEVRITFLHELGHYLGWDEEDMERHGLE